MLAACQFTSPAAPLGQLTADWLIAGVWEGAPLPDALDSALGGLLKKIRETGDLTGKRGELVPVLAPTGLAAQRLLLVGLGKPLEATRGTLHDCAAAAGRLVSRKKLARLAFLIPTATPPLRMADVVLGIGVGLAQGCVGPGLRKGEPTRYVPDEIALLAAPAVAGSDDFKSAVRRAHAEARAVGLARELVNLPPNELYPETFAQRAQEVAAEVSVECTILEEAAIKAERMGALLGVARGSERGPRVVVLRSHRGGTGPTLGLVGKGVTFDSGGLSLKTTEQMVDMKCDMAGAAAVLAAVVAVAELRTPVNVLAVLPLVENMPSGKALKLGDVLTARNRKTIEVLNTDAEGRLILADALAYAVEQKADHLVDLATLTGACMVALGTEVAGLFGNRDSWSDALRQAARRSGEKIWPLPMDPHYEDLIKSQVADIKNTAGTRYGGAIAAAKFLEQFVAGVPWAHLDIAGPAWAEHENPVRDAGGTGFGVRTLIELALQYPNPG
jgi:leucyl aminopeptidase